VQAGVGLDYQQHVGPSRSPGHSAAAWLALRGSLNIWWSGGGMIRWNARIPQPPDRDWRGYRRGLRYLEHRGQSQTICGEMQQSVPTLLLVHKLDTKNPCRVSCGLSPDGG